jgi:putative tryptophan/tyrosine transport system substrate-binding protein
VKRREFILLLAGLAPACVLSANAQQSSSPVIGFLHSGSPEQNVKRLEAFRKGLSDEGFIEGQNLVIEYRWAAGKTEMLPAMAADLIQRQVSLIATPGSSPATMVAKNATKTIPIVIAIGADPVALGLVASVTHPGGNITGITSINAELAAKRLGVMRDLVPKADRYFTLVNPGSSLTKPFIRDLQAAAGSLGIRIEVLEAATIGEVEAAFAKLPPEGGNVLVFPPDSFFYTHRERLGALAIQHRVPSIFDVRDYVDAGGLASYGTDFLNVMQLAGNYAGRILKGEKPGDLPIQQTTKFELAINTKTAKALGIEVPPKLLFTADAVVE